MALKIKTEAATIEDCYFHSDSKAVVQQLLRGPNDSLRMTEDDLQACWNVLRKVWDRGWEKLLRVLNAKKASRGNAAGLAFEEVGQLILRNYKLRMVRRGETLEMQTGDLSESIPSPMCHDVLNGLMSVARSGWIRDSGLQVAAALLSSAANGASAPWFSRQLAETTVEPMFKRAFGWLPFFRDCLLWPKGLEQRSSTLANWQISTSEFRLCLHDLRRVELWIRGRSSIDRFEPGSGAERAASRKQGPIQFSGYKVRILKALLSLGAVDEVRRKRRQDVADKLGQGMTANCLGRCCLELGRNKFTKSEDGRGGGIWLTRKGLLKAQQLGGIAPAVS